MEYKSPNTEFEAWAKTEGFDLQRALVWGVWTYYEPKTAAAWLAWTYLKPESKEVWINYADEAPVESGYYDVKWGDLEGSIKVFYSAYADEWSTMSGKQPTAWSK